VQSGRQLVGGTIPSLISIRTTCFTEESGKPFLVIRLKLYVHHTFAADIESGDLDDEPVWEDSPINGF
jgi:hypothetical protein